MYNVLLALIQLFDLELIELKKILRYIPTNLRKIYLISTHRQFTLITILPSLITFPE